MEKEKLKNLTLEDVRYLVNRIAHLGIGLNFGDENIKNIAKNELNEIFGLNKDEKE